MSYSALSTPTRLKIGSRSSNLYQSHTFSSTSINSVWVQKKIEVKLRTDVPNVGRSGQTIKVKPGHMRQRLYPSGQALYCSKDGIPFQHRPTPQPTIRSRGVVPSPGLSRPIVDLIKRLGVEVRLTKRELERTEDIRRRWVGSDLSRVVPSLGVSEDGSGSKTREGVSSQEIKSLIHRLRDLERDQTTIKFIRSCPTGSENLYGSIKSDEILERIIGASSERRLINIVEVFDRSSSGVVIRTIKRVGQYGIRIGVRDPGSSDKGDVKQFEFLIDVIKDQST